MQTKTIKKIITNKLNDWLNSIDDKLLAKDVKNSLVLSGGSITNLLLGQDVNDYDIYLQDMDVLLRLGEYYCKNYGVEIFDGRNKENYLLEIKDREKYLEEDNAAYSVFIRNLQSNQIKLKLFYGGLNCSEMNKDLYKEDAKYVPLFFSPNAISLSDNVQIVLRFSGTVEEIHKTFDFIHATNYFTFTDGVVYNNAALLSILTKCLSYQGSCYPLTSIIRVRKFIKRGWNISAGELLKIMYQISELDLNNPDILEEQLIGVDVAYFSDLIGVLRDTTGDLTSSRMNEIIDKVFNESEEEE
jgi:hypothetical protein